jgi:soluble lytic murein transglycosylase-like protein
MLHRWIATTVLCVVAASCGGSSSSASSPAPPATSAGAAGGTVTPVDATPATLAAQLVAVDAQLARSIDAWKTDGGTASWPPPPALVLQAVTEQRIFGTLALHPALLRAALPMLPAGLRAEALANATAAAKLLSLVQPSSDAVTFKTRAPLPADTLLADFRAAQARFGVPWQVLAAVNLVESRFGRVVSNSSAGAQGPMQFIPATWAAYGLGGDVHDPHDAIMGAANYLHASGAPADVATALFHYNPASTYVHAVLLYAHEMMRDPRTFYAYYNWQVFVLTPQGLKQLTGPGS